MRQRGRHHIHCSALRDQLIHVAEGRDPELLTDRFDLDGVRVMEAGELPLGQLQQLLDMDTAQVTRSQHTDRSKDCRHGRQK